MSYAMRTRLITSSRAENRPGSLLLGPGTPDDRRPGVLPSGGGASLTEATSNVSVGDTVCARRVTPSSKPNAMGAATANNPAPTSSAFVPPFGYSIFLSFSIDPHPQDCSTARPIRKQRRIGTAKEAGTRDPSPHNMAILTFIDGPDRESVESLAELFGSH